MVRGQCRLPDGDIPHQDRMSQRGSARDALGQPVVERERQAVPDDRSVVCGQCLGKRHSGCGSHDLAEGELIEVRPFGSLR
ncbi:hypothetical protein GCM10009556_092840 [Acrocarpospora pleiomorpha]